jgi:hypothetical protein
MKNDTLKGQYRINEQIRAKEVAKRLLCFKGIKKSPKKFN